MAKKHEQYKCNSCGKIYLSWVGKCTQCGEWNTIEEYVPVTTSTNTRGVFAQAVPVKSVVKTFSNRIDTGNSEINRMFGGGIVKDSVSIISAPPGAGKSTFATYLCGMLSEAGYTVLYASGEESESQIKSRMDRVLGSNISDNLYLLSDPRKQFESVASAIDQINPDFIVLDSIQTFTLDRCAPSRSGSPTQVVEVANELVGICKNEKRPRAALIIGQMIKNDELAGPRQLEHLVDAVYYFEGDPYEELRICTSSKNRFGELETVFFNISEGMRPIDNPSEHLLTQHKHKDVIGSAITIIKEGTLPIAVEVESLIGKSFTPYPSRIGDGLRRDQLSIILNILEQRQNINFYDKNVIVKSGGNIKLHEPSCNLAIAASLISAYSKRPIPEKTVFIGDIGLTGEIKKIQSVEAKIKEAERMGFSTIFVPNQKITGQYKIEIIKTNHVLEIFNYICSKDAKKPE